MEAGVATAHLQGQQVAAAARNRNKGCSPCCDRRATDKTVCVSSGRALPRSRNSNNSGIRRRYSKTESRTTVPVLRQRKPSNHGEAGSVSRVRPERWITEDRGIASRAKQPEIHARRIRNRDTPEIQARRQPLATRHRNRRANTANNGKAPDNWDSGYALLFRPTGEPLLPGYQRCNDFSNRPSAFTRDTIVPFFYRVAYVDKHGLQAARKDLWGERPHDRKEAMREYLAEMEDMRRAGRKSFAHAAAAESTRHVTAKRQRVLCSG